MHRLFDGGAMALGSERGRGRKRRELMGTLAFGAALVLGFSCSTPPSTSGFTVRGGTGIPSGASAGGASDGGSPLGEAGTSVNTASVGTVASALDVAPPSSRVPRHPRCDPFSCRALPRARVFYLIPGASGWSAYSVGGQTYTDDNGSFALSADLAELPIEPGQPLLVGVAAPDNSYSLATIVPHEQVARGATIDVAVDRTTTVAALLHCPTGVYPPPKGGYCWLAAQEASTSDQLYEVIDNYFAANPLPSASIRDYIGPLLADPNVLMALNSILAQNGLPPTTGAVMAQQLLAGTGGKGVSASTPSGGSPPTSGCAACAADGDCAAFGARHCSVASGKAICDGAGSCHCCLQTSSATCPACSGTTCSSSGTGESYACVKGRCAVSRGGGTCD